MPRTICIVRNCPWHISPDKVALRRIIEVHLAPLLRQLITSAPFSGSSRQLITSVPFASCLPPSPVILITRLRFYRQWHWSVPNFLTPLSTVGVKFRRLRFLSRPFRLVSLPSCRILSVLPPLLLLPCEGFLFVTPLRGNRSLADERSRETSGTEWSTPSFLDRLIRHHRYLL